MPRRGWLLAVSAAAAIAWLQLPGLHWAARAWAVILLVPLPALLIVEGRRLSELESVPRRPAYLSSILSLWLLAAATFASALLSGHQGADLGLRHVPPAALATLSAGAIVAAVSILFLFRWLGMREAPLMRQLLPTTPTERVLFAAVSLTAGVCEELIFRGFLIHVLHAGTGSLPLAVILSSGAFGVAHAYQQPAGAMRAGLLGLVLALPLLLTGSILPSMLAHAGVDLLSGFWLARYLLR